MFLRELSFSIFLEVMWYLQGISSFLERNVSLKNNDEELLVGVDDRLGIAFESTIHLNVINDMIVPMCPLGDVNERDCWSNPFCISESHHPRDSIQCPDCGYRYHSVCVGIDVRGCCGCLDVIEIAEG